MIRRLDLDYERRNNIPSWAGWLLLVSAIALSVYLGFSYIDIRSELSTAEAEIARAPQTRPRNPIDVGHRDPETLAQETVFASEIIGKLSRPWDSLFDALATANNKDVALLSIEPRPDAGTVILTGQARNYPALLAYLVRLSHAKPLSRARLSQHEIEHDSPDHPVSFSITATWATE